MTATSEHLASRVLDDLDELTPLPIDIFYLASAYGLTVKCEDLPRSVEGIYIPGRNGIVVLNQNLSLRQRRFALAHELYHHLDFLIAPRKTAARFKGIRVNNVEEAADDFASAILMPKSALSRLRRQGMESFQLSDVFDVPIEEVRKRLSSRQRAI